MAAGRRTQEAATEGARDSQRHLQGEQAATTDRQQTHYPWGFRRLQPHYQHRCQRRAAPQRQQRLRRAGEQPVDAADGPAHDACSASHRRGRRQQHGPRAAAACSQCSPARELADADAGSRGSAAIPAGFSPSGIRKLEQHGDVAIVLAGLQHARGKLWPARLGTIFHLVGRLFQQCRISKQSGKQGGGGGCLAESWTDESGELDSARVRPELFAACSTPLRSSAVSSRVCWRQAGSSLVRTHESIQRCLRGGALRPFSSTRAAARTERVSR